MDNINEYISALVREIESYKREPRIAIDTVYFGGGTPSLLLPSQLEIILNSVRDAFDICSDAEITMEMNPGTVTESTLKEYLSLGINRASLGVQSIHDKELKKLGRIHSFDDVLSVFNSLRRVGFDNISVDLMYGIPYQNIDTLGETLDKIISLAPEHISAYGLIIEEGTRFYKERDSLPVPSDDEECDMYYLIAKRLADAGYSHYEISNYAHPGRESRHNLKYWRDEEYIGVGLAAYSYFESKRFGNTRILSDYISGVSVVDSEDIDRDANMYEYAMMHLRLREGISLPEYERIFGVSFLDGREGLIKEYTSLGLVECTENRISLTESGFYVSNTLLANLL